MNPFKAIIDLVLPRRCVVCGRRLHNIEHHICLGCLADLPQTYFWVEEDNKMAVAFRELTGDNRCNATSLFYYRGNSPFRNITLKLKYEHDKGCGVFFSGLLAKHIMSDPVFGDLDLIIPVPIHWIRRFRRGYNQSDIIGETLSRFFEIPVDTNALYRTKRTKTQTKLSVDDKIKNVRGAFGSKKTIKAKHILLVDDVYTSGATLLECYKVLKECTEKDTKISIATLGFVDKL